MARYKQQKNYAAHNLNNCTVILFNDNYKIVWEGLESVEAELDQDENTTESSADGLAIFIQHPELTGTIKVVGLEASASTDEVNELFDSNEQFRFSCTVAKSDNFKITVVCMVQKRPATKSMKEPDKPERAFTCTYLFANGGSYAEATV